MATTTVRDPCRDANTAAASAQAMRAVRSLRLRVRVRLCTAEGVLWDEKTRLAWRMRQQTFAHAIFGGGVPMHKGANRR